MNHRPRLAKLEQGLIIPVATLSEWDSWSASPSSERVIGETTIGETRIVTVFLGVDLADPGQPPQWFQSMVIGGRQDGEIRRYATLEAARSGHQDLVTTAAHLNIE